MARPQWETSAAHRPGSPPGPGATSANATPSFEGRILVHHRAGLDVRTASSLGGLPAVPTPPGPRSDGGRPARALASPGLMVLAAVAVMEGYHHLHLISSSAWCPPCYPFAVAAPLAAVGLTRPGAGHRRSLAQRLVVGTAVALCALTPVAMVVNQPLSELLVGTLDIVAAVAAVGAVLMGERQVRWRPEEAEAGQAIG